MKIVTTTIPGLVRIEPQVFTDSRGVFVETWHRVRYAECGVATAFVQDNLVVSKQGVLRGLHLQYPNSQGKLVQVLFGAVFDVMVDVRRGSPWFGQWVGYNLTGDNHHQFWVPPGFAHGYYVLSHEAVFAYKCTNVRDPSCEISIRWDDPNLAIDWPLNEVPLVSAKDQAAEWLTDIDLQRLPIYAD